MKEKLLVYFAVAVKIVGLFLAIAPFAYMIYLKFKYPDMTEMRFLLSFWREIILSSVAEVIGAFLINA